MNVGYGLALNVKRDTDYQRSIKAEQKGLTDFPMRYFTILKFPQI